MSEIVWHITFLTAMLFCIGVILYLLNEVDKPIRERFMKNFLKLLED